MGGYIPWTQRTCPLCPSKYPGLYHPGSAESIIGGIHPQDPKDMSFVFNKVSTAVLLGGGQTDPSNIMHLPKCENELVDVANF